MQNDACKKPYMYVVTVVKKETSRVMVKKFRPMRGGGGQWGWRGGGGGGGVTPTPGRQVWSPSKLYHTLNRTKVHVQVHCSTVSFIEVYALNKFHMW